MPLLLNKKLKIILIPFSGIIILLLYIWLGALLFQLFEQDYSKMKCFEIKHQDLAARLSTRIKIVKYIKNNVNKFNLNENYSEDIYNTIINDGKNKTEFYLRQYVQIIQKDIEQFMNLQLENNCDNQTNWNFVNSFLFSVCNFHFILLLIFCYFGLDISPDLVNLVFGAQIL